MTRVAVLLAGATLAVTACSPPHPRHEAAALKSVSSLDCPESQGDLTRKSAASDGKSCLYADDAGAEVTLQLISLDGMDPKVALAPLENQLRGELPPRPADAAKKGSDNDRVDIDLPGVHIHADGNDNAKVDVGGVSVNAQDSAAKAGSTDSVSIAAGHPGTSRGGVTVDAADSGAEIHVNEPGGGVRLMVVLASDAAGPNGYKLAGYEARGPVGGPLVVASAKAKSEDHDELYHDMKKLLDRNVGR
ncbi:MAG: hypothetical protein H0X27_04940 [Caulobacteraceae bacterium]|nr:hypothetical protein [Caulobacteraceae bacterium]